jgi:hypothetical protein
MVTDDRLRDLEFIADLWLTGRDRAKKRFDELVQLRNSATLTAPYDTDFLNQRIEAEDHAVSAYHRAHTFASSLVARAMGGEDV